MYDQDVESCDFGHEDFFIKFAGKTIPPHSSRWEVC